MTKNLTPLDPEEKDKNIQEYVEEKETLIKKVKEVAELIKRSKRTVVHTGAGISTASNIPSFRGPKGVWTLRDRGITAKEAGVKSVPMTKAKPSKTHQAIKKLMDVNYIHHLVSCNIDGLHLKSGISREKMDELHGNIFVEDCRQCGKEYIREHDVTMTVQNPKDHITGGACECGYPLRDTIIHFDEKLNSRYLERAIKESTKAEVMLVLGTSLKVAPANQLVFMGQAKKKGKVVLVNLQHIPQYDKKVDIRCYAKADDFMSLLLKELDLNEKHSLQNIEDVEEEEAVAMHGVYPRPNCPHVMLENTIDATLPKQVYSIGCATCPDAPKKENWVCLGCGHLSCSRYQKGHALEHYKQSKHPIAISLYDLSFWCYECNDYIVSPLLRETYMRIHAEKFPLKLK